MIIFLSELQKEHLSLIHGHSAQGDKSVLSPVGLGIAYGAFDKHFESGYETTVTLYSVEVERGVLVDFCKLSIDYLNNGANSKKISLAAEKMSVSPTVIQNLIHALVHLIVEGCKHNLSEPDFRSSLALAGFSSEHQDVLIKLYNTKKTEISSALQLLHQKDPSYQDLNWRFEVQISSRHTKGQIKPMVAMDFVLMTPKNIAQSEDSIKNHSADEKRNQVIINTSIQDSKAASHCQNVISHVMVQCDLPNLVHLTNTLDQALKESKSLHVRKVQRSL